MGNQQIEGNKKSATGETKMKIGSINLTELMSKGSLFQYNDIIYYL